MSTRSSQENPGVDHSRKDRIDKSDYSRQSSRPDCDFNVHELFHHLPINRQELQNPNSAGGQGSGQVPDFRLDTNWKGEVTSITFNASSAVSSPDSQSKDQGNARGKDQSKDQNKTQDKDQNKSQDKDQNKSQDKDQNKSQDKSKPAVSQEQLSNALAQESANSENRSKYRARNGDTPPRDVGCASTVTNLIYDTLQRLGIKVPYSSLHTNRVREIEDMLHSPALAKLGIAAEHIGRRQMQPGDIVLGVGHRPGGGFTVNANHAGIITRVENGIAYVANNHAGIVQIDELEDRFGGYKKLEFLRLRSTAGR